jgi:streptogramin lyase
MTRHVRASILLVITVALAACSGGPPASSAGNSTPGPTGAASAAATGPVGTVAPTPVPLPTDTPLGDRLVATITVPRAPCALAADATSVWVTGGTTGELIRIDPSTNAVTGKVAFEAGSPCGVAIGPDGRIWVALLGTGAVVAVDPATMQVTERLDGIGPELWDLKAGFGSIWVADRTAKALLRIDPKDASIEATIPIGPLPSGLAVMADGVWVSDDTDSKLRRIDPATNAVAATVAAAGAPSWFADDGAAALVIAERGAGKVLIIDPSTGALGDPSAGWNEPLDGTVVGGEAWIPEGSARRVGVFGLATPGAAVVRYALPGAINPFVAEPAFGDVWVLDFGGTTIWRIRP